MALQVWLPLINNVENQGVSNIPIINNGITFIDGGKIGNKCASFNNNYFSLQNLPNFNAISVSFWMKPSNTSQTGCLLNYRVSIGGDISVFLIDGKIRFDAGGQTIFNYTYKTDWQHITVTYDGNVKSLYINGILNQSVTINKAISCSATKGTVGASSANTTSGSSNNYIGLLNDYRIYDHCLSPKEVKEISRGMVLHYKMCQPERAINLIIGGNKLSAGGSGDGSITASNGVLHITSSGSYNSFYCDNNEASGTNLVNNLSVGDKFTVSFDFKSITSNSNPGLFINEGNSYIGMSGFDSSNKNKWQRVYCIRTWAAPGTRYGNLAFHINNIVGEAYIRNIKIEKGENHNPQWSPAPSDNPNWGTIEYDGSGFKNHGTVSGNVTLSADSPRYTGSYKFGTNNYITTTSTGNYIKSATFWAKDAGSVPGDGLVFRDQNSGLAFGIQSGKLITGAVGGPAGSSSVPVSVSDAKYTANTWHFFACINDNGTHRLYMDGIQISTGTGTGNWSQGSPTNSLNVGGRAGSSYWPGYISDFKMYVTVLSATDVQELYKLGRV